LTTDEATYSLLRTVVTTTTAIRCHLCGRVSEARDEIDHGYCARCHLSHEAVRIGRALVRAGGAHECQEWRTFRGVCALCGVAVPREGA